LQIKKEKKKKSAFNILVTLAFFAFVIGCIASIINNQYVYTQKKAELSELQAKADEIETKNGELERILNSGDMNQYMEMLAIEQLNYSYPNERRFYDTSRD
jgi:cell division protein FtsB